jgi:hypothetical protein
MNFMIEVWASGCGIQPWYLNILGRRGGGMPMAIYMCMLLILGRFGNISYFKCIPSVCVCVYMIAQFIRTRHMPPSDKDQNDVTTLF